MTVTINDLEFDRQILAMQREVVDDYALFIKRVVFGLFQKIVDGTPVDTGRARGNWFVTRGSPSDETAEIGGPPGGDNAAIGTAASMERLEQLQVGDGFDIYWIVNNLPYIVPLEEGTSTQAPQGWIRIALAELEAEILSAF